MRYMVLDSNLASEHTFADSYRGMRSSTPALRHSRGLSVGFPAREMVEVIREPVYEYSNSRNSYFPGPSASRHASRAASVALLESEPSHYRATTPAFRGFRETTPLDTYVSDTPKYDHYRRRRYNGYSHVNGASHIYRPSMWYIGTAGFREESNERTRRMQSRLEGLMTYEPPPLDFYLNMRQNLRGVNELMMKHRQMLDRYATEDATPAKGVEEAIQERYFELVDRMPELERGSSTVRSRAPSMDRSRSVAPSTFRDVRAGTPSVSGPSEPSAVRGKIRKLLNRTKHSG